MESSPEGGLPAPRGERVAARGLSLRTDLSFEKQSVLKLPASASPIPEGAAGAAACPRAAALPSSRKSPLKIPKSALQPKTSRNFKIAGFTRALKKITAGPKAPSPPLKSCSRSFGKRKSSRANRTTGDDPDFASTSLLGGRELAGTLKKHSQIYYKRFQENVVPPAPDSVRAKRRHSNSHRDPR